jgi:hypothetical protein
MYYGYWNCKTLECDYLVTSSTLLGAREEVWNICLTCNDAVQFHRAAFYSSYWYSRDLEEISIVQE